ncbi:radical SAM protein [Thiorhodococcus mannitoliphagus]|uniref:Radical SAM protein n=1 Tax=Thiorhodococcus mannitoliphagus TaxID=329406 RepID=A0A6P1DTQ9_9GAMM|nr:radical SAM protein [Thiorhodococcus mannitoliphagus]NEX21707.1 radical SAM protein [Thiorhodococcus mannitoliphagus]
MLEKPLVFEKILRLEHRIKAGMATPVIDIEYSEACNLKCSHCFNTHFKKKNRRLKPADLADLSKQAHKLGLCQFVISGGEPLVLNAIREVIEALNPQLFHLAMSTNGFYLTREMAENLKAWGLDKVKVSLDDFDPTRHDENRKSEGAYDKAMAALFNARDAGLSVTIQTCITHLNCRTERTEQMAMFAADNGFVVDVMIAHPIGEWEGRSDLLIDEEDAAHLREINSRIPALHRDTFPTYGIDRGCGCVNSNLHLTRYGDIMPCGFIPISIGNIFEESLKEILDRGLRIKHFKNYNPLCLSGEDRIFIDQYITSTYGKELPLHWSHVFTEDDFKS